MCSLGYNSDKGEPCPNFLDVIFRKLVSLRNKKSFGKLQFDFFNEIYIFVFLQL